MAIEQVRVSEGLTIGDYAALTHLAPLVRTMEDEAREPVRRLAGRTVWMVSSTREGGGVAEALPRVVALMRQLGVKVEWCVIHSPRSEFFELTKRIHNRLHGIGEPDLGSADRALFESVSRDLAGELQGRVAPRDLVVVHDPQPLGVGAFLKEAADVRIVWRCHIGLDRTTPATEDAWRFLAPYARAYDRTLFSLEAYIPRVLADRSEVLHPSIDPLSHKNRDLAIHKLTGVLVDAALAATTHPILSRPFKPPAMRLQADGSFAPATIPEDIGFLFRPIVTQVSRWDRLKGFGPLFRAFADLKRSEGRPRAPRHQRRIDHARLVLAGPDPAGVQDDPEAGEVFREICGQWRALPADLQRDVVVLDLPMASRKENALMVNAIQRCSSIVVQNSLREGFGLTVTEAMWKARPVAGTRTPGIRAQIRDGDTGRLIDRPDDPAEIARVIDEMMGDDRGRAVWGRNARDRVAGSFLIFNEARCWLDVLSRCAGRDAR